MKLVKKLIILLIILETIAIISILCSRIVMPNITVKANLKGKSEVTISIGEEYKDDGIILKRGKKELSNKKYKVTKTDNIDNEVIGTYTVKYTIKYKKKEFNLKRTVNVVDTEKPVLTLNFDSIKKDFCTKKIKTKFEYTATDNYDGDLTDKVAILEKENSYIFKVVDSSGNYDEKEIEISDEDKPANKFTLNGKSKMSIIINGTYNEPGATYVDGCGNKIDKEIKITGDVDTTKTGNYTITYEVEGEKAITRNVNVYEVNYNAKTIYLTFDDGPGAYTKQILDTLDKYNAKATFFVTNQFPSYSYLIAEEHNRGHAVAVHTYTHNYGVVYSSVDGYINDFNQMNEIINQQTGSYSNLFRFPGGSSNTVSRNYSQGVVSAIASEMTSRGYVYFDWDISSGDAAGKNSSQIYNAVVNGAANCSSCVILMHDIKSTTANALDNILATLSERGYTFATLNTGSPTAHHRINN